ncbi:hypothetical protein JRQ81_003192 [Phrynocephalus forsythii]|uniref:Tyr recombinase domain-containing protein n=1 Tax=Phrynocephalus forsythii TaxID=171643 RepID=A0A9Q0XKB9_9SAUR|nr:hypothetical protein JRQ81_003192 [Phrynocephalus forsythii]
MGKEWRGICRDEYEQALMRAASLVAFFGAFRISELVAAGKFDTSRTALQVSDLRWQEGSVVFWVRQSKTDQLAKGQQVVLGPWSAVDICLVAAIEAYYRSWVWA